ncbi:hypothetical protein PULV_a3404 [Pseudoalteromonas ulvae UL12]|uniref:Wzz/FepE/Etk N-terminal domain-containing protein n=1 Tax=Pseudoalteromonas ulvae TaxID=107327 RepID=UPI00186B685D|nr:Wzz/FepE/Etk N-terminal domain-containing protein [Pseudoalteromonas ulvae]MBE0365091.1 hypothetical protein [Pseudoalteromonas ulvae UL12]
MSQANNSAEQADHQPLDLIALWLVLWRSKWSIIGFTIAFTCAAVVYSLQLPNIYKSSVLLSPQESQDSGLSGLAGQFGGLASVAGINLAGGNNDTAMHIEIIKSKDFLYDFFNKHNIAPLLFAVKEWDKNTEQLIFDELRYDGQLHVWQINNEKNESFEPSQYDVYERFLKLLSIFQNKTTGLVTIEFEHQSPSVAKNILDLIVADINELMRQTEINDKQKSIEFLGMQLTKTSIAEMKNVFYSIIEEQTKLMLLAEVRKDFVFKVIDSPIVEERKSSPNRAIICIASLLFGGLISCLVCLVLHFYRSFKTA